MKVLLLGGEGFVGFNLLKSLSDDYDCCSAARNPSAFRENFDNFIRINPYEDIMIDPYDVYIHLIDNKNCDNIEEDILKNIPSSAHIILFSSAVIYANPNSEYGIRKLQIEELYNNYCEKRCIKLTILRLFNIYGKYQIPYRQGSLIANILYNHINSIKTHINDMSITRNFIFAEDVAKYIQYIIKNVICGTYDIATWQMYSIANIIKIIEDVISDKLSIIHDKKKDINCPMACNIIPCKIEFTALESGMIKLFGFYKKNNALVRSLIR